MKKHKCTNNLEDRPIYTIATFEKLEKDEKGWWDYGAQRTVGFYYSFDYAECVVMGNGCDIYECLYEYAIIEEVYPGLYPCTTTRWIYKYNAETDGYERIDEPEWLKRYVAITIG